MNDDVKRVEVKIDKHIQDDAEIKRASYEEKESLLRQKKMKRDMRAGRARWIISLILLLAGILIIAIKPQGSEAIIGCALLVCVGVYHIIRFFSKL